jgi:hypothetical protein
MEPRVWKWLVPAFAMVMMVPMAMWVNMISRSYGWEWLPVCSTALFLLMPFLGIQAWAAFKAYYRRAEVQDFVDRQNALANTAEVRKFEYSRSMHPEVLKLLLLQEKTVWRVKEAKPGEFVDWVLDADPSVRAAFVEYVLQNSTKVKMMPMNGWLGDKTYDFDPDKLVTDYDQYRGFHRVLINRGMATEAFGNQPGQWIDPWTPELVAAHFGVTLDVAETTEKKEDQPK